MILKHHHEDLGLHNFENDKRSAFPFKGGYKEGIKRLNYYLWESKRLVFTRKQGMVY